MRLDKLTIGWTAGVLTVTAAFLSLVTRPQINQFGELMGRIEIERREQASGRGDVETIRALQQDMDALTDRAASLGDQIPQQELVSAFVEDLGRYTKARQLQPDRIEPGKPIRSEKVVAMPIAFSVHGSFEAVYGLIRDIEQMPRLTHIEYFSTRVDPDNPGSVSADVNLRVFFQAS